MKITIINGPNLNLLGQRNQDIYGSITLSQIEDELNKYTKADLEFHQTNSEGEIINLIQNSKSFAIILNPGAFGHYSYAIRDAIEAVDIPVIEVHISNVFEREKFRHNLVLQDVCAHTIVGHGTQGYFEAIDFIERNDDGDINCRL